jgi:hypothetical protein
MTTANLMRWGGPVAIPIAMFMVMSDLSGMAIPLPGSSTEAVPLGFSVIGSGMILWALVLLLVGMIGLYVRLSETSNPRRIEEYEIDYLDHDDANPIEEKRVAPKEEHQHPLATRDRSEAVALGTPQSVLVVGTGLRGSANRRVANVSTDDTRAI